MFVASRRVIQGAIRVKVHRIVRDVVVHMQRSVFFLQSSRAHGPYRTVPRSARRSSHTIVGKTDEEKREREREGAGRIIAGGRGDKKGEEATDAFMLFIVAVLSRQNECRYVCAYRVCGRPANTTSVMRAITCFHDFA